MSVSILDIRFSPGKNRGTGIALWGKTLALLVFTLIGLSSAFGQSADLDQGENGSASSPKTIFWQNGNLGPSGAHFAEGYSIPYRMRIASLVGDATTIHTLVIEWDTKDQNGHALDYITHYNNLNNPVGSHQANFSHGPEAVDPTAGTAFSGAPLLYQIPTPSSTGAEVAGQPASSFTALPTAARTNNPDATKMAIWGGTIVDFLYLREDNQDATTASTKTQLRIRFRSANGSTALLAWGGHIAAEYDWGPGRGASKVSGSPYHMRLISIDGKGGNQDRSLKASAVFVPPLGCTLLAAQTACEGTSGPLTYSVQGSPLGVTNYSWTLTPGTTNAVISGGNTTTTKSGASVTSINIVPASGTTFAPGTFTVSLTLTNLGGNGTPCTQTGTINQAATAEAGANLTACQSSIAQSISLTGASVGGSATSGTWSIVSSVPANAGNTLSNTSLASGSLSVAANYVGVITLQLTSNDPDGAGPCAAATDTRTVTIVATPAQPTAVVKTPLCTDATMTVEVTLPAGLSASATVTLKQMTGGASPMTKNASDAVGGKLTFTGLTFGKGYSITITDGVSAALPAGCTSTPLECGDFTGGTQNTTVNNSQSAISEQEIVLRSTPRTSVLAAPNPFNDRIRFTLKSEVSGRGSLELYNALGQRVKIVFQGQVSAGQAQTIEYAVPGSQRANLIYVFRVGSEQTTGKLIGLKQ